MCGLVLLIVSSALSAAPATAADPVIAAAGDIACSSTTVQTDRCHQKATSDLLVNAGLSAVLTLGDAQYQNGALSEFMGSYDKSWGRVKSITYPSVGNHEYQTSGASGYFDYFNGTGNATGRAGDRSKGYYSFDIGTWHLISLNSSDKCTYVSCTAGSPQETWLKADLAAHTNYCTLAYWHHPSFNSGNGGNLTAFQPLLQDLYNANADVILGGHAHHYERFAPQNPSSQLDNARGIRQFVVGTGGAFFTSIGTPKPNSQIRQNNTYGVLKMTLHPTGYDWVFVPEAGGKFTDSGTGTCHGTNPPPSDTTKPSAPGNLTATAGTAQIALNWQAATDNVGVTGYQVFRGTSTTPVATLGVTTSWTDTGLAPGTYSYTVKAVDAAGNVSDPSNSASATVQDVTKPAAPANLTATAGTGQVALNWQAATDNVGVTGYRVFRGTSATPVATLGVTTTWTDTGLAPGTYSYTVKAVDAAGNISDPSNSASATVLDTTKPNPPGNLTATAGTAQVTLNWQAATDNVGVTGYQVFRGTSTTPVATLGVTTTWTDTGLAPGTYSYTVKAVDAAGNISDPSNSASATVLDTTKPSAPTGLTGTANGPFQADLRWDAAIDDVAVTGYNVYRDGNLVATTGPVTSYSDTVLVPASYSYTVKAFDAAGNLSDASNTATVTMLAPDGERPTSPANLRATLNRSNGVDLTWDAATDNVAVTGYDIYRDNTLIDSVGATTSYTDSSPAAGDHSYTVKAVDAAGNRSDPSNAANVTVPDTQKPSAPANLRALAQGSSQVNLTWNASTDNVAVTGYEIYRDNTLIDTIGATTSYSDTSVTPNTYSYVVRAIDAATNRSDPSNTATVTVNASDTEKPSAPGNLQASSPSSFEVDLTWNASTDNVAVTGYEIYRDNTLIDTIGATTSYSDTTATAATTYSYTVRAVDAAGNQSDPSNAASATTPAAQQTLTLSPDADAQVKQASPTTNFGTDILGADFSTSTSNIESYLRFTVSGVPAGSVRSAKLRLHSTSDGTANGPAVYTSNSAWSESTINWNNRPARTSAATDDKGAIAANSWVEYDVTSLVNGTGTYSFELATDSTDGVYFSQREASTFRPELVITTGTPDTEKPSSPGNLTANAIGPNRIDLGWLTSTDNVAVTGYNVYRGGTLLAGIGATNSYSDTAVSPGTGYSYYVRSLDAAGNISDPSNTASATTPSAPAVLTLSPDADAIVRQASPTTNYATDVLGADFSTGTSNIESFIRFTVSGIPAGKIPTSVKLRLHSTSDGTADGPAVYTTGTSWSETAVNWTTRPAATSAATDDKGAIPTNSWVEYDVTPFVTANGTYSFRIATSSTDGVYFSQREASTFRPELVVTLP